MYPGQIHRLNQARRAAELQQQPQVQSQPLYVIQQQSPALQTTIQQSPVNNNQVLQFSIKAKKLMAADWNGKSDPYLEFYRLEQNGWTKVHSTPVQFKTLKPVWSGLNISLDALCYCDRNRPILLRCFDYDEGKDPNHLGDCQFNVQDLLRSSKFKVDLKPATPSVFNRHTGRLTFYNVSVSAAALNVSKSPQHYQQQPQQYQQPQQQPQQPQQAQRSSGGYPGIVYRAANAQMAASSYGAQYQTAPLVVNPSQQGFTSSQQGYTGQQNYVAQSGGYPGNQSVYTSNLTALGQPSYTSHVSPISSPIFSSNAVPANQSMYASTNASCSVPSTSTDELDNLPPPPSYEELFSKK